jgi:hemerythrin-like domain-containing protein
MKRHPGLVPISHEHRQILFAAQIVRPGVPRYRDAPATLPDKQAYLRAFAAEILLPHTRREEELLFPRISGLNAGIDSLLAELGREHRRLDELLHTFEAADDPTDRLAVIGLLLESHVRREERQLFQAIQQLLSDEALHRIGAEWQDASGDQSCVI